jgi:predicted amidohydrolase YtcJ
MKQLADDHALRIKHWVMVREGNASLRQNKEQFARLSDADGFLTVKAVKVSLDGALGSYGAWLLQPYSDRKGWTGLNTFNIDSLRSIAEFCWDNGLQLCVHAIGDRANRETIDLFAEQIRKDPTRDHRWRVEHAQHVHPDEIPRFKQWSIIASMQSIHCTSDAPFVEKRLGPERAENGAYLWKAFLNAGVVVNNGTDVPVEKIDPFANFYAAVTRKLKDGSTFYPAQKMTRAEALYSYTMANAYAAFQEKTNGSIETGKYADLVVLDTDLLNSNEDSIPKTKVVMTLVNGVVEFERK